MSDETPPPAPKRPAPPALAIAALLLAAGAVYAVPYLSIGKPVETNGLQQRIDALEARISLLEKRPVVENKPVDLSGIETRLAAQAAALDSLKKTAQTSGKQISMLAAFNQMKEVVENGTAFREPWERLHAMARDRNDVLDLLTTLSPYLDSGASTLPNLQKEFATTLEKALPKNHLQSLVRIRKTGEAQGADDEAILARAEARLQKGDIAGALKELNALSPPAADAFAAWAKEAKGFLAARDALNRLQIILLQP